MHWLGFPLTTLALFLCGEGMQCWIADRRRDDPVPPPIRETAPPPRQKLSPLTSYEGVVTAIEKDALVIRGFQIEYQNVTNSGGNETGSVKWADGANLVLRLPTGDVQCHRAELTRETLTLTLPSGDITTFRRADLSPRRFPVDEVLAGGSFHAEFTDGGSTYRLSDVRVGDEVYIRLARYHFDGPCYAISICRRPGGRVPPAPGEQRRDGTGFHDLMNAYQAFEDKDIPIPAKFRSEVNPQLQALTAQLRPGEPIPDWYPPELRGVYPAPPPRPAADRRIPPAKP